MFGELIEPHRMNSCILVLILDLIAAFLGACRKGDALAENLLTAR